MSKRVSICLFLFSSFVLFSLAFSNCVGAEGYWEQVDVKSGQGKNFKDRCGEQRVTISEGTFSMRKVYFAGVCNHGKEEIFSASASWTPPPKRLNPGEIQPFTISAKRGSNIPGLFLSLGLSISIDLPRCPCGSVCGGGDDLGRVKANSRAKSDTATKTVKFKVPAGSKDASLAIRFCPSGSFHHGQPGFRYIYQWVQAEENNDGSASHKSNGKVEPEDLRKLFCDEALGYYSLEQVEGLYSGKGKKTLNFSREDICKMFSNALLRYAKEAYKEGKEGNNLKDGTRLPTKLTPLPDLGPLGSLIPIVGPFLPYVPIPTPDALNIAQTFDTTGLPTGNEKSLHTAIRNLAKKKRFKDPKARLTPEDIFYLSLKINKGNVRDALCTCHSALHRGTPGNKKIVDNYLAYLRNKGGYSTLPYEYTTKNGTKITKIPSKAVGTDEQGVWYHLFGIAALEFTDGHNFAPFFAVQTASYIKLPPIKTEKVRKMGFHKTNIGGILADFAIGLEDSSRVAYGAIPDPDKFCINFTGIAVGVRLKQALIPFLKEQEKRCVEKRGLARIDDFTSTKTSGSGAFSRAKELEFFRSPLSLRIEGSKGEVFTFDQRKKRFGGNTLQVFFLITPEEDDTWGLTIAPFFKVANISYQAVASGKAIIAVYDIQTKKTRWDQFKVQAGQHIDGTLKGGAQHENSRTENGNTSTTPSKLSKLPESNSVEPEKTNIPGNRSDEREWQSLGQKSNGSKESQTLPSVRDKGVPKGHTTKYGF